MDPNQTLQELLDICTENIALGEDLDVDSFDAGELTSICDRFLRMTDLFETLNNWIRVGGFLPEIWQVEQDKLSSQYFKAELSERFPWLLEIRADGKLTEDFEEPGCVDVVNDLAELWSEVISGATIKPELVHLSLHERQMINAMIQAFRDNIGEDDWELPGFGEDAIYGDGFDIIRKLDGQPQPPTTSPVTLDPPPARFQTDDGYVLIWDQVNRRWATTGGDAFDAAGWAWWPVDSFGEPLPGRLLK